MSTNTQVAVLGPVGREAAGPGHQVLSAGERPLVRVIGFAALGLYGVLRWGTLMYPAPTWRLIGLLALAVTLAACAPALRRWERAFVVLGDRTPPVALVGVPLFVLAVLAAFALSGVPFAWVRHWRIAVTANGIGDGLSALPTLLVPYSGINEWVRVVMLLGAAILLLDAALLLAFAPPVLGDVRRAGAALPLIALVVVPDTLVRPQLPYLHGLVLFALLAFFMWGERVPIDRRAGVVFACGATGAAAMIIAPAIDRGSPWINYQALASDLAPAHVETFDWAQNYGPLVWPRTGKTMLQVKATPGAFAGEYWKAEDLNTFDGQGWVTGDISGADELPPGASARELKRWTQTLEVTIKGMTTTEVIAAGGAHLPTQIPQAVYQGTSPGTWITQTPLDPGDSYTVQVYNPDPTPTQLAHAGDHYPLAVQEAYLQVTMPLVNSNVNDNNQQVLFGAFGSRRSPRDLTDEVNFTGTSAIQGSPYAAVYATARGLERGAKTPYAYVKNVMNYLNNGAFTYDEYPPVSPYPLVSFLTVDRIGYCQQFAGSMALLLRMGGVPARVATGFTTGTYNNATKQWSVTDVDAHAWVEAWFPHYGWVTFDPTPAAAPARGGRSPIAAQSLFSETGPTPHTLRKAETPGTAAGGASGRHHGGSSATPILIALAGLAGLLVVGLIAWIRLAPPSPEGLLAELERALARSGRPVAGGVTLAGLERRFRTSPEAAGYIRALRLARFGDHAESPTLRQRRALRAQLRAGLGFGASLRALWALPPRPERARKRPHRSDSA